METYVIDTNIFFNMEAGIGLGKNTEEVVKKITEIAKKLKKNNKAQFVTSPRIVEEFLSFFEDKNQDFIKDFLSSIIVKSPEVGEKTVAAQIIYQIIEDIRLRSYRGLSIGEEEIKNTAKNFMDKKITDKKEFEITVGKNIKGFRDRYRNATRTGFIDSLADLDCIVLAKVLDGYLVTTDEGVIKWGRIFGVKEMPVVAWLKQMQALL
jgi:RNA ligase partner protein